jgi:NAD(P)-dependent dehydrogenase (short-subunit alcohol dehydrogenase family)
VVSDEEVKACLKVLEAIVEDRGVLASVDRELRVALLSAAGRMARPELGDRRKLARAFRRRERSAVRAHDARVLAGTLNREKRRASGHVLPASTAEAPDATPAAAGALLQARSCYVCKGSYHQVHHFYDSLCPPCAELNFEKRFQTASLDGQVALVTGARIKIGYQASLMLLRAGASVVATTRFPRDAVRRYAREPDFAAFAPRLALHALDLRDVRAVERFCAELDEKLPRLDHVVNNAAQTVRRPPGFYAHLAALELVPLEAHAGPLLASSQGQPLHSEIARHDPLFPSGRLDLDEQQLDLRRDNSWRMTAAEVPTLELLEVHLVNAVAPFLLNARLKPLMLRHATGAKHIVNVSAMEAQFARNKKTDRHPHTNMAKAALNMMTRTSAVDYARDGIFMNSVDTGWITDEDPLHHVARKQDEHDFHPPLDAIDGAARVLDPIFVGAATGEHMWGLFLKDYKPVAW